MRYLACLITCIAILGGQEIVKACFIHSPLPVELIEDHITIKVKDRIAVKTYTCTFYNPNRQAVNGGTCYMEVEPGAQVDNMTLRLGEREVQADILDVEKAKKVFQEIIAKGGSPALLEFYGKGLIRAQVPNIPPLGTVTAVLQYTTILESENGLFQMRVLNTNPKALMKPLKRVTVHATLESTEPIKAIYSPTHPIEVVKKDDHNAVISFEQNNYLPKNQMAIYWHTADENVGVSTMSYRDGEEGTFMMMLAPTVDPGDVQVLPKDIIFCIDTSGSMTDDLRLQQVKKALRHTIEKLGKEDRFNIVAFSTEARPFQTTLVAASAENRKKAFRFIDELSPRGATAIEEALERSLEMFTKEERPRMLVFLTDGTPTIGETDPGRLVAKATQINEGKARIFVFGVGENVNTKLLDNLASDNGGTVDYVLPKEDVTDRVANFYDRIANPVLSDIKIRFNDLAVTDIYPRTVPDLFKGQQISLFGRYKGYAGSSDTGRTVVVTGMVQGKKVRHEYRLAFPDRATSNDFLPRVWAGRKVAFLIDQVKKNGENKEVIAEIVSLAKRYGIVTPYTSYLVAPDTHTAAGGPIAKGDKPFKSRLATSKSYGGRAVQESKDMAEFRKMKGLHELDREAEKRNRGAYRIMRTIGTKTFYFAGGVWHDSEYDAKKHTEIEKIKLASDRYMELVKEKPSLVRFLSLGKMILLFDGKTYQITG